MRFSVESWSPDYGVGADDAELADAEGTVDVAVERSPGDWAPITPAAAATPERIVFVDGVRRIDARVWITGDDGSTRLGVCASVAAGAVCCDHRGAHVVASVVRRGVFTTADAGAGPIVTPNGTYELVPATVTSSEELNLAIHDHMTRLESDIDVDLDPDDADHREAAAGRDVGRRGIGRRGAGPAGEAGGHVGEAGGHVGAGTTTVVFDGPLRGRNRPDGVGFVKTQRVQYLPDEQHRVVAALGDGDRTPLFLVGGGGGFTRWSWYLRLPGPRTQPLAGIVRCEIPGIGTVAEAARRADTVSAALPRFASEPHKDGRAPQNLYPIAGLELRLRHLLGDPLLLERSLRRAAAGG